jgi:glycosyltransferase involved in cell wall biosynthesis
MPRRVLHILGDAQHEGTGIARVVSTLARKIDPQRYEISACFVGDSGPLVTEFQSQGIPTRVIKWLHPHRDAVGLLRLWWALKGERFDIIHLHWGGRGVRWVSSRASSAKLVFHLHGRINENESQKPQAIPTKDADAVIAVSQSVARTSLNGNTRVVYSGLDTSENLRPESIPDMTTIGTAGRLVSLKGIIYLLRAMSLLQVDFPLLRLEVAGIGSEISALKKETAELGLNGSVKFLGWIPDMKPIFYRWTIFVQPSLEEGFGIAVLEAMAAGLPVIASAVGGLPEIVDHGVTGMLVPAADPVALADCLRQMLSNVHAANSMGNAAALHVQNQFSSQKMTDEICKVYDDLLNERAKAQTPAILAQ